MNRGSPGLFVKGKIMSEWRYSKNGQQHGPVTSSQLKELAAAGQIGANDLVWKDGMAEWTPASSIDGLFAAGEASEVAAGEAQGAYSGQPVSAIGYYNPAAGLSGRVQQTLKGFPPPTGMQGEWPLSDLQLAQLKEAEKNRKALRGFNSLCQLFVLFGALGTVGFLIGFIAAISGTRSRSFFSVESLAFAGGALAASLGMTVLYYLCGKAALRCRIWGPITVIALLSVGMIWTLVAFVIASSANNSRGEAIGPVIVVLLFGAAFVYVSVRGLAAIPKFLAAPLWAQEALVNAKL